MKPTSNRAHSEMVDASERAEALERQVEEQAETAKRAIREYKNTIFNKTMSGAHPQSNTSAKLRVPLTSIFSCAEGWMSSGHNWV